MSYNCACGKKSIILVIFANGRLKPLCADCLRKAKQIKAFEIDEVTVGGKVV